MASKPLTTSLITVGFLALVVAGTRSSEFSLNVNNDGTYNIEVNGKTWLPSGPTYFYADGTKYSSADGSLKLAQKTVSTGVNKLGEWESTDFLYYAGNNEITASIKTIAKTDAFFFTQKYRNHTTGTASGPPNGNNTSVSSAFPSFQIIGKPGQLGYLSYGGQHLGYLYFTGKWTKSTAVINDGVIGGPLLLFDHDGNVLIISSFSEFMAASLYHDGDVISWGIMGGVEDIPAMYEMSFIVYYSDKGINQAMDDWGKLMKFYYDRDLSYRDSDLIVNYLGYWTDAGAYYYVNPNHNKTYQEILIDLKAYADKENIPYRYIQYDNWWYYKGDLGGIVDWEARPEVFPDGLQYVHNQTGWPIIAHNKWWSVNTTYAKQNGGKYGFIIEEQMALPNDTTFWTEFLLGPKQWGLVTYEQDFLNVQFLGMKALLSSISLGREWLMQMGEGAAKNDLTVQYCMSNPRHGLQSLEIPVVTQARVSHDYRPSREENQLNWQIGITSMFANALGLAPFKDNFWTTAVEPGNVYNENATNPVLEAIVSTLSTGPMGNSDMVGLTDVGLLMRCCNTDGLILKPSRPAISIDKNMIQHAFGDDSGPNGDVWSTVSDVQGYTFGTIFAPNQSRPFQMTPADAGFGTNLPWTVIFKHTWPTASDVANFSQNAPLSISGCVQTDPCLWHTLPVLKVGWTSVYLFGELTKWVPMSPKRVTNIEISEDVHVTLVGAVEETVNFSFSLDPSSITTISCNLGLTRTAVIGVLAKSCRPV